MFYAGITRFSRCHVNTLILKPLQVNQYYGFIFHDVILLLGFGRSRFPGLGRIDSTGYRLRCRAALTSGGTYLRHVFADCFGCGHKIISAMR